MNLIPVLRWDKGIGFPPACHADGINVANEHRGFTRLAAVQGSPDGRAHLILCILGEVAVVRLQIHGPEFLCDVVGQIHLMAVNGVDADHIIPTFDDFVHC